jgi:dTDP-4-dehydrorhamnose reductase
MKIMITGISGQVGRRLVERLAPYHHVIGLDRQALDLSQPTDIRSAIDDHQPDVIINPAAFTAVDRAESEPDLAAKINTSAPAKLGEIAQKHKIPVIHFSTDYVFDGQKQSTYVETDPTQPLNVYGQTKRDGEIALLNTGATALILRTSWVFDAIGQNFFTTMLRLACGRDSLQVVSDQRGAPTSARALADAVAQIISHPQFLRDPTQSHGIYHITASGSTTWHEYACSLIREARARGWPIQVSDDAIERVSSDAFPTAAKRPRNSQLNTDKLENKFQIRLPTWTALVDAELRALEPSP